MLASARLRAAAAVVVCVLPLLARCAAAMAATPTGTHPGAPSTQLNGTREGTSTIRLLVSADVRRVQSVVDCWTSAGEWVQLPGAPQGTDPWTWVPRRRCAQPLPHVVPGALCATHVGSRLLFIGDSMSAQNYGVMVSLARAGAPLWASRVVARTQPPANFTNLTCDDHRAAPPRQAGCVSTVECGGHTAIAFVRNDHLLPVAARSWDPAKNVLLHPTRAALAAWRPTLVVLNRGAHYTSDDRFRKGLVAAVA